MTQPMAQFFGLSSDASKTPQGNSLGDPYRAICDELYGLLVSKRDYYGCREDALANAMSVQEDGIAPDVYQLARIGEKRRRLQGQSLSRSDRIETFLDIMGHAAVAIACIRKDC